MPILRTFHSEMQYAVLAALIGGALLALWRLRTDRTYQHAWFALAMVVVDVQVLAGILIWFEGAGWQLGVVQGVLHPLLGLAVLGVGHAALSRARKALEADAAHRLVALGLLVATALAALTVVTALFIA